MIRRRLETSPSAVGGCIRLPGLDPSARYDRAMGDVTDIVGRIGLSMAMRPVAPTETAADLDTAVQLALAHNTGNTVVTPTTGTGTGETAGFQVQAFGPAEALFAPPVISVDSSTAVTVTTNGGERLYVCSNPTAPNPRWVDVPGLDAFYRLPAVDHDHARNTWADRLSQAVPEIDQAAARALPIPRLRTLLAHHAQAVFPVSPIHRGVPPVDAGGIVNGVTLPTLRLPLREPDC